MERPFRIPSQTPSEGERNKPSRIGATVITATLFWVWTALFHDVGALYFLEMSDSLFDGKPFGAYLNCTSQPLGFAIGSLIYFFAGRKGVFSARWKPALFGGCIALFCLFYFSLETYHVYALSSGIALCAAAIGAMLWMDLFVELMQQGSRSLVTAVIASMATRRICSIFLSAISPTESLTVAIFLHGIFLALSYPGFFASEKEGHSPTRKTESPEPARSTSLSVGHAREKYSPGKIPWQLFLHLLCYGIGFGTIHGTLGVSNYLYSLNAYDTSGLAMSITGLAFALAMTIACTRKLDRVESLWQRVRGVVFPLVIISYSLIPILGSITLPSTLAEDGNIAYSALFVLGCFMMTKETDVNPFVIASVGCFFKCMGFFVGILLGYVFGSSGAIVNSTASQLVTLAVFIAFSLGTFWIGSERQMRHWWGLRCVRTPQYQHNRILEEKCDKLARLHELSPRETELLAMLAQGKRAATIKEECDLSIFTVRNHIQNIYRKLDIHSIDELSRLVGNMQED